MVLFLISYFFVDNTLLASSECPEDAKRAMPPFTPGFSPSPPTDRASAVCGWQAVYFRNRRAGCSGRVRVSLSLSVEDGHLRRPSGMGCVVAWHGQCWRALGGQSGPQRKSPRANRQAASGPQPLCILQPAAAEVWQGLGTWRKGKGTLETDAVMGWCDEGIGHGIIRFFFLPSRRNGYSS